MIYLIGDTHFYHANIIGYCQRPFYDEFIMNEHIISCWNNTVSNNDLVIHLGDFSFGSLDEQRDIARRLNGDKLLIMGNHDRKTVSQYKGMGFVEVCKKSNYQIDNYIFSHRPVMYSSIPYGTYNIHGHIHNNKESFTVHNSSYFNASCEVIDYTPIAFDKVKEILNGK
jgi:calcineurin-like phosphoesterase family protein